jgi:hypothetical protein
MQLSGAQHLRAVSLRLVLVSLQSGQKKPLTMIVKLDEFSAMEKRLNFTNTDIDRSTESQYTYILHHERPVPTHDHCRV